MLNYSQDSCCISHVVWFIGGSLRILDSSYLYVVIREGFWIASARSKVQQNNLQTRWVCYASATHDVTIESFSVFNSRLPSPCWCLNCRRSWPSLDPSAWTWTQTAPWDTTEGSWKRSGDGRRDLFTVMLCVNFHAYRSCYGLMHYMYFIHLILLCVTISSTLDL